MTHTAVLQVDDVVALRLNDHTCPVGQVVTVDEFGVRLALYHWYAGVFDEGKARVAGWSNVVGVLHAHPGCGGIFQMDPLADYQREWTAGGERATVLVGDYPAAFLTVVADYLAAHEDRDVQEIGSRVRETASKLPVSS